MVAILEEEIGFYSDEDIEKASYYVGIVIDNRPRYFHRMLQNFMELSFRGASTSPEELRKWAFYTWCPYIDLRCVRPFNTSELRMIKRVLPSEQLLLTSIDSMPDFGIQYELLLKSMVTFFCEDFPIFEAMQYCNRIKRIDDLLDSVNSPTSLLPFRDYEQLHRTRTLGVILGDVHLWWKIANRSVRTINGVSVKEQKEAYVAKMIEKGYKYGLRTPLDLDDDE